MHYLISDIEKRLDYIYTGFRKDHHCFKKLFEEKETIQYYYYKIVPCEICGKPYLSNKTNNATKHNECSLIENKKKRKYLLKANQCKN